MQPSGQSMDGAGGLFSKNKMLEKKCLFHRKKALVFKNSCTILYLHQKHAFVFDEGFFFGSEEA